MVLVGNPQPVPIVGDGSVSTVGVRNGRFIPLVILDTRERRDVEAIIEAHRSGLAPGDVLVTWGELNGRRDHVALICQFIRPVETLVLIEFAVFPEGILVDQALVAKALYIQAGQPGDRLRHDLQKPRVLIEVPDTGFQRVWDKLFLKSNESYFRAQGFRRSEARTAARQLIARLREVGAFRIPSARPDVGHRSQQCDP
jgi:hypothetical protein